MYVFVIVIVIVIILLVLAPVLIFDCRLTRRGLVFLCDSPAFALMFLLLPLLLPLPLP